LNDYLNKPVTSVKGIGEKTGALLAGRGITTVYDILTIFPVSYIDSENISEEISIGTPAVYQVEIEKLTIYRRYAKRFSVINIFGKTVFGNVHIRIFNQPYMYGNLKTGQKIVIFGNMFDKDGIFLMDNPILIGGKKKKIIPLYPRLSTIGSGRVEKFIDSILLSIENIHELLPDEIMKLRKFTGLKESLKKIHSPGRDDLKYQEKVRERFRYTEFFIFHLELSYIRKKMSFRLRNNIYKKKVNNEDIPGDRVGFSFTEDQKKALKNILDDMYSKHSMQRILMGEVGSGKTVVAFSYLLVALLNGFQGAFLAPTGVLAFQHFENAKKFFKEFKIALLTGKTPPKERKKIVEEIGNGKIDIVFGTHSLIYEKVKFNNLSAIVIDEQQRFGVSQRAALFYKGSNVDLLVTTATPIPRTLQLSLYDDLNISSIRTLPKERKPVKTFVIDSAKREDFYLKLRERVEKGEQGYIVVPLIEDSENFSGMRSLESEFPFFEKIFSGIPIKMISGRTPEDEKNLIFERFKKGKITVLISTTVIEVGMDVKSATFIIIEDADRFGLSQLHQLRGRVGRGDRQSVCYLLPREKMTVTGKQRIKTIREYNDGFKIAEMDMKMRGSGVIQGFRQSGRLDFRLGDPKEDIDIFRLAKKDAKYIIENYSTHNKLISEIIEKTDKKLRSLNFS